MRLIFCFIILAICTFPIQCKKLGLASQGKTISTERAAQPFTKICLFNNIDLILTQDTIEKIVIEAGDKLQSSITTSFAGDSLLIKNTSEGIIANPDEKIIAKISVKLLKSISYQGSGTISCSNYIYSDYFDIISNNGAGNVYLKLYAITTTAGIYNESADFIFDGHSDSCYTYCSSRGTIQYQNFVTDKLLIDYSSVRNAYVNAPVAIYGNIFYKGNIYYKGAPAMMNVKEHDTGRFIPY
jgi:hypothetical protein